MNAKSSGPSRHPLVARERAGGSFRWFALLLFLLPGVSLAQAYTPPGTASYAPTVSVGSPFKINFNGIPANAHYNICWESANPAGPCEGFGNPGGATPSLTLSHVYTVSGRPQPAISQVEPQGYPNGQVFSDVTVAPKVPVVSVTPAQAPVGQTVTARLMNLYATTYQMDWGDRSLAETQTAASDTTELVFTHVYAAAGRYSGNAQSTTDPASMSVFSIAVNTQAPILSVVPSSTTIRQTVTANASNLVSSLTYTLNWGDGTTDTITGSTTAQKTHTYAAPGTYTVILTATEIAPVNTTVTVSVVGPTITVTGNGLTATLNLNNLLIGYSYIINWDDGTTEALSATGSTAQLNHTYIRPGSFTVQVTPQGGTPVTTTLTLTAPTPVLGVSPAVTSVYQLVTASVSNLVSSLTYTLNWGDGTTDTITGSTTAQKTHTYLQARTYSVSLTSGGTTPVSSSVTVAMPVAGLTASSNGLTVTVDLTRLVPAVTYTLDWGDGSATETVLGADVRTLTHRYAATGIYILRLNAEGMPPATVTLQVQVASPGVDLTAIGLQVTALISGVEVGLPYTINWGDGTQEALTAITLTHTYALPGTYTVEVGTSGVVPTSKPVLVVASAPILTVSATGLTGTARLGGLLPAATYILNWGDGSAQPVTGQTDVTLTRVYGAPGQYTVTVTATDVPMASSALTVGLPPQEGLNIAVIRAGEGQYIFQVLRLLPEGTYAIDYGDGTVDPVVGSGNPTLTHTYARSGTYTATMMLRHRDGSSSVRVTAVVQVRLDLLVQGLSLSFSKPQATTDLLLNTLDPFEATLTVTYRGSGRLDGSWRIDGRNIGRVNVTLPDGNDTFKLTLPLTETRLGRHTLTFAFKERGNVPYNSPPVTANSVTYALSVPGTLTIGGFTVKLSTVTSLDPQAFAGTGTHALVVGGALVGDQTVTLRDLQVRRDPAAFVVTGGTPVTVNLNNQALRNAHLGDARVTLGSLTLTKDGGQLSGTVALPNVPAPHGPAQPPCNYVERSLDPYFHYYGCPARDVVATVAVPVPATLTFRDAPLAPSSGDLLAPLIAASAQVLNLNESGLTLSASAGVLDLSAVQNDGSLAEAYRDQTAPQPEWMGVVIPAARLTVDQPLISSPARTLTRPVAYTLSGYTTNFDLASGNTPVVGWNVNLSSLHVSVAGGRVQSVAGGGTVLLPMLNETMNVALGWNPNAPGNARWTLTSNASLGSHSFGRTSVTPGEATWKINGQGKAQLVFANASWNLGGVSGANVVLPLSNLTLTGAGDASLGDLGLHDWVSLVGPTSLQLFKYPFPSAEIGVQRQADGQYTIGLRGKLQVLDKLPLNAELAPVLFWVRDGRDVKFTIERIHIDGELKAVKVVVNLDGTLTNGDNLEFNGDGTLTVAKKITVAATAGFGRDNGTSYGYVTGSVARITEPPRPFVTIQGVGFYEFHGGLAINMVWPGGNLDAHPVKAITGSGTTVALQAGTIFGTVADAGRTAHFKGTLGFDSLGNVNIEAKVWLFKPVNQGALAGATENGRALVSISAPPGDPSSGRLLVQACVGPSGSPAGTSSRSGISSGGGFGGFGGFGGIQFSIPIHVDTPVSVSIPAGLDCSGVAEANFYNLLKVRGSMELYAPFSGDNYHLYVGTKQNPIAVKLLTYPEQTGYLMVDRNSLRAGAGASWSYHNGDSGSIGWWKVSCDWYWNLDAQASLTADFGVIYSPIAMDASVDFNASASASAGGCGIGFHVGAGARLIGMVHIAQASRYFDGSASAYVSLPVIPNISFNVHAHVNF
jgi:PKD repeat protein